MNGIKITFIGFVKQIMQIFPIIVLSELELILSLKLSLRLIFLLFSIWSIGWTILLLLFWFSILLLIYAALE